MDRIEDSVIDQVNQVVLGGLLSTVFLNMVVLPALCIRFYPNRHIEA